MCQKQSIKYLGSWLDETLSFREHITKKCKVASLNLYNIRNIQNFLMHKACQTLVLGLVISHLNYNNALLIKLPNIEINWLQMIQNMATKWSMANRSMIVPVKV